MKMLPTDLMILQAIYDLYCDEYHKDKGSRSSKVFVPINHQSIATRIGMDEPITMERLCYLEQRYGYKSAGVHYSLFPIGIEEVNFAFMTAVLADLQHEHRTSRNNFYTAAISAAGAVLSAIFAAIAIFIARP